MNVVQASYIVQVAKEHEIFSAAWHQQHMLSTTYCTQDKSALLKEEKKKNFQVA